jgi:hypothetical protein
MIGQSKQWASVSLNPKVTHKNAKENVMHQLQINTLTPEAMRSIRGGFLLAALLGCGGGNSESTKSFDNGCTVGAGTGAQQSVNDSQQCENLDHGTDQGDGPNSGMVQGK